MDLATQLALRAIVRGLFQAGAIGPTQIRAVTDALKDAAGAAMDLREPESAKELLALAKGVKTDIAAV